MGIKFTRFLQMATTWFVVLFVLLPGPPNAHAAVSLLQQSLENLNGRVLEGTYISPSRQIICKIPDKFFSTPKSSEIVDANYLFDETFSLHLKESNGGSNDLFLIKKVSRLGIGSSTITNIDKNDSPEVQIDSVITLIESEALENGLSLSQKVLKEHRLTMQNLPAKFIISEVTFMETSRQIYGHMVLAGDGEMIIFSYMPLLARSGTSDLIISPEKAEQELFKMASQCRFDESLKGLISIEKSL